MFLVRQYFRDKPNKTVNEFHPSTRVHYYVLINRGSFKRVEAAHVFVFFPTNSSHKESSNDEALPGPVYRPCSTVIPDMNFPTLRLLA